ncbi:polynucleotide 5'-hydroxyl-kinase NOL9-like [Asterias rubens]|uniref:polynucleotide 5'-hydroxyl-kinase NOL9-like n=1 Tax=Asterias rubens TaxID=7604 RepID=UPI001455D60D|nr:polynucleotide 5'-hydroxyl-kinase NOL9-like [Asterias rubens]XP_033647446.1 polynucleotide 5'-hydroxyl-kinase NOL9-like [Asterias rubens]
MGKTTRKATRVGHLEDQVPKKLKACLKPERSKKVGGKSFPVADPTEGRKSKRELQGIMVKWERRRLASSKTETKSSGKVKDGLLRKGSSKKKKKKSRLLSSQPEIVTSSNTTDPSKECIWEVDPSSSSDNGVKTATKCGRRNPTSEAVSKFGGASVHDSPCITIVDLAPGFRFGTHQAVSLPLTVGHVAKGKKQKASGKSSTDIAVLKNPAGKRQSNLNDGSDDDNKFENGMSDGKFHSQLRPMDSVFVVELGTSDRTSTTKVAQSVVTNVQMKSIKELCHGKGEFSSLRQIQNEFQREETSPDGGESEVVIPTEKSRKRKKRKSSAGKRGKGEDCGSVDSPRSEDAVKEKANQYIAGVTTSDKKSKKSSRGLPDEPKENCSKPEGSGLQRNEDEINIEDLESAAPSDEAGKRKTKRRKKSHEASSVKDETLDKTPQEETTKEGSLGKEIHLEEEVLDPIEVDEGAPEETDSPLQDDDETPSETDLDLTMENSGESSDNIVSSETPLDGEELQDVSPSVERDNSSYRIIKLRNSDQCLALLSCSSQLAFHGRVLVRSIHGSVTVLGFPISASREYYPLYSPSSSCALCLETASGGRTYQLGSPTTLLQDVEAFLREEDEPAIEQTLQGQEGFVVALILKTMPEDTSVDYVERFPGFKNIFSSPENRECFQEDVDQASSLEAARAVGFQPLTPGTPHSTFSPLPGYQTVIQAIQRWQSHAPDVPPVVLICGWKNSGKSTLCRYLSNSLIARLESVCYLEFDVGQTEFTPPGMLSLQRITEPVLGPPFTHSRAAERMCFYGDVHVHANPDSYLKICKYLMQEYQTNHRHQPLIINTMGWMQGLGLQLLVDIIHMTQPTHIVQLWSPAQPRVIQRITQTFLEHTSGWLHQSEEGNGTMMTQFPEVLEIDVPSIADKGCAKFKASDHRTMALLAGLSKLQPSPLPQTPVVLSALIPLVLPWRCVAVHVTNGHVPLKQIMYALNGSVVGLCQADPSEMCVVLKDHPKVFKSTPVCQCHGLGIIRGIDPVQKVFYILAAISKDALPEVNALFRGALSLPQPLLTQGQRIADVPYVSREFSSVIIGSGAIKVRRNIKQRGR